MPNHDPKLLLKELAELENLRGQDSAASRRQFKRFVIRGDAQLIEMNRIGDGAPVSIMLRDMSRGGVGFITDRTIETGTFWNLRLMQRGYCVAETAVTIRHGRKIKNNVYLVGSQICMSDGLMVLIGIDPMESAPEDAGATFLAPNETTA